MSSVAKVFGILETIVAHQARGLAYSEVVAKTQVPKATAHRLLKSLVRLGYLRFNSETGRYFGHLKLATLGSAVISHFDLTGFVRPHLVKLQAATHHTCNLGILNGDVGIYLDKLELPEAFGIKLYSAIGKPFPLHCTGMGKVLLAGLPPARRRRLLARRLEVYTTNTITDPALLSKELEQAAECGYAVDREEITRGIVCVAAPIVNGQGETVAAISVAFAAYVERERGLEAEIKAVIACASEVSREMAGQNGTERLPARRRAPRAPRSIQRR
jgi:DNA-binding IclR family transcriptional regulator